MLSNYGVDVKMEELKGFQSLVDFNKSILINTSKYSLNALYLVSYKFICH